MFKLILSTFLCVFVAELGDKTQLQTMMLAAKSSSVVPVFIGASLALMASSLLGVLAGTYITRYIPPNYIQNGAGMMFVIMGILILLGKI